MVVSDDFGGISAIIQWLSYVPKVRLRSYDINSSVHSFVMFVYYITQISIPSCRPYFPFCYVTPYSKVLCTKRHVIGS